MSNGFFVVSSYGHSNLEWLKSKSTNDYCVYLKDNSYHKDIDEKNIVEIDNVGYNIYSYMKYIVDNYEILPDTVIFCKNNVYPRHVSEEVFKKLINRKVFTSIEDPSRWSLAYPVTMLSSDNGFMELNNSWYASHHPSKYFSEFNDFWKFIFECSEAPRYLRFAPGANYVVPKENIKLRSREFYNNIMTFVSHHQFSGESHMVERALHSIWNSTIPESKRMSSVLSSSELLRIIENKSPPIDRADRFKKRLQIKIYKAIDKWASK